MLSEECIFSLLTGKYKHYCQNKAIDEFFFEFIDCDCWINSSIENKEEIENLKTDLKESKKEIEYIFKLEEDELKSHPLKGKYKHFCHQLDRKIIDETCPEFIGCDCIWKVSPEEEQEIINLKITLNSGKFNGIFYSFIRETN